MTKVNNETSTNSAPPPQYSREITQLNQNKNINHDISKPNQFSEESKSNPLNLKITDTDIKNHDVSVGSGKFRRILFSILDFLRDIFSPLKSWLGIASPKPEKPAFDIEKQIVMSDDSSLGIASPKLEEPAFDIEEQIVRGDGSSYTKFVLTPQEKEIFEKNVTSLQKSLETTPLNPKNWLEEGRKSQFTKDFNRNGIKINNYEIFSKKSIDSHRNNEKHISNLIELTETTLIDFCNQDEYAAEALTRFLNQQIAFSVIKDYPRLPIGENQDSGYIIPGSELQISLDKLNEKDPIKINIDLIWPSDHSPKSFIKKEDHETNEIQEYPHLASKIISNFKMEFNPPQKDLSKNYENAKASDYFQHMKLTKELTIEVYKNGESSLVSKNALLENDQDEFFDAVDGDSAAFNALHSEESQKTK